MVRGEGLGGKPNPSGFCMLTAEDPLGLCRGATLVPDSTILTVCGLTAFVIVVEVRLVSLSNGGIGN